MNRPSAQVRTREPLNAEKTFRDVTTDEDFEQNRERYGFSQAFAVTAAALVELGTHDSGYRMPSVDRLHVVATMNGCIEAQSALDNPNLSDVKRRQLKREQIIPFNHALGSLIDNDPNIDRAGLLTYLNSLYRRINFDKTSAERQYAADNINIILIGIAQENYVEQLANHLGYDVEPTSVEAELKGVDRYLGIEGAWEPVDVKASKQSAEKARARDYKGELVLCSGVNPDWVNGAFRLSDDQLERYADRFERELADDWARVKHIRKNSRR